MLGCFSLEARNRNDGERGSLHSISEEIPLEKVHSSHDVKQCDNNNNEIKNNLTPQFKKKSTRKKSKTIKQWSQGNHKKKLNNENSLQVSEHTKL
jgi:hypothetical protein